MSKPILAMAGAIQAKNCCVKIKIGIIVSDITTLEMRAAQLCAILVGLPPCAIREKAWLLVVAARLLLSTPCHPS